MNRRRYKGPQRIQSTAEVAHGLEFSALRKPNKVKLIVMRDFLTTIDYGDLDQADIIMNFCSSVELKEMQASLYFGY